MLTNLPEIIEKVKKGDQPAFRLIVEEYRQQAFSLAFRIVCDEEEARDIVQDSFVIIWEKIDTYKMNAKFSTWMLKIVANKAIDRLRRIKRHHMVKLDSVIGKIDALAMDTIDQQSENSELAEIIRWLSAGLPEKQQLVFIMRDIQGMESDEVQEILGMSETSVKSNLYHARISIREKLMKELK